MGTYLQMSFPIRLCSLMCPFFSVLKRNRETIHTSKIWGLSQKKMYISFFARYQLYNISIDEKYCF